MESNPFAKAKEDFKAAEDSLTPITEEIEAVLKGFGILKRGYEKRYSPSGKNLPQFNPERRIYGYYEVLNERLESLYAEARFTLNWIRTYAGWIAEIDTKQKAAKTEVNDAA